MLSTLSMQIQWTLTLRSFWSPVLAILGKNFYKPRSNILLFVFSCSVFNVYASDSSLEWKKMILLIARIPHCACGHGYPGQKTFLCMTPWGVMHRQLSWPNYNIIYCVLYFSFRSSSNSTLHHRLIISSVQKSFIIVQTFWLSE